MYAYALPVPWISMSPPKAAVFGDRDNQSDAHARINRDGTGVNLNWKAFVVIICAFVAGTYYVTAQLTDIHELSVTSDAHTATLAQMGKQFQRMDFKLNALLTKSGLDPMTVNRQATALLDDPPAGK